VKLVIAEKPSVARTIAEVIGATNKKNGYLEGDGYIVSWCIGHLLELVEADVYQEKWKKWSYESLPIIPEKWQHTVKENTKAQYVILASLMNREDITEIICATDAGREGELIFRLVYQQSGSQKPIQRLWISSMEEKAIETGFSNLKPGSEFENLYQSALCRSKADWLVGINGTRLFTVIHGGKTLKVGRVQTPTLGMLVERELKIKNFIKEKYYVVHILWEGMDAVTPKIEQKTKAEQIAGACQGRQALVASVLKEEKHIHPPKLYDLTSLQREANRVFGYTAKQTLEYTQSLYEKKLLTYPRTDSQFLTEDMKESASSVIRAIIGICPFTVGIEYQPNIERILDSSKVSDHHAIIPTNEIAKVDLGILPKTESAILYLVANRLLCATGQKYTYESVKAELTCSGETFTATGKSELELGWKDIERRFKKTLKIKNEHQNVEDSDEKLTKLPNLAQGMIIESVQSKLSEHLTTPPKAFTEDTLLSAMENAGCDELNPEVERKGLGTPATRADIIEKLVKDGFVIRERKQLRSTEDGIRLINILPEIVKSPQMTADWENDLTLVAKGEKNQEEFMFGIEEMVKTIISSADYVSSENKELFANNKEIIGTCPKCGEKIYESKVNYYCSNKGCDFTLFKNNKYFASMRKEVTKTIAKALFTQGCVNMTGLYSVKKNSTFDATIIMTINGQYPQFSMEFTPNNQEANNKRRSNGV